MLRSRKLSDHQQNGWFINKVSQGEMVVADWFYTQQGTQYGPVPDTQLKQLAESGELKRVDLVWAEGMKDWVPAGKLKGLFANASTESEARKPPPIPPKRASDFQENDGQSSNQFENFEQSDDQAPRISSRYVRPNQRGPGEEGPWEIPAMIGLVIGAILIPLVGIIFGIIGLGKTGKKAQGGLLLGIAILRIVIFIAMLR